MQRWLKGLIAGAIVALSGIGVALTPVGARFEHNVGLPWLFNVRGTVPAPDEVVVVAMDSRTGDHLGLPPLPRDWPRSIHARLLDELMRRGAAVVVFDVHFGRDKSPDDDQAFVDAVARSGRVVLVELLTGKRRPISDSTGKHVGMVWAEELVPPFADLADAAAGLATFPLPKEGASVFQFWVFKESTDNAPTLPAVALQLYARRHTAAVIDRLQAAVPDASAGLPSTDEAFVDAKSLRELMRGLRGLYLASPDVLSAPPAADGERAVPLEQSLHGLYAGAAHRYLNFYGPPGTIRNVPYHAVIKGGDPNVPDEALDFSDQVVFVGYADLFDPGQPDRFYTVFTREDGVDLSGVEIAATGFGNLLTNRSLTPADDSIVLVLLAAFGILIGTLVYVLPAYAGVPAALALAAAYAVGAQTAFNDAAVLLPIATPLLVQTPLALFIGLLGQYLLERRRGQRISEAINYYLPDDIARDLTLDRLDEDKINRVVYGACLATDMAGFSTISEQLPPGELARFLNDYFETLAEPLKRHGVHVTEFRADAIMCAWTSNQASPEPRRRALLASLDAGSAIEAFKQRHEMAGARLRIGLEAGQFYIGHAGGGGRFVYSIVGDTANTASRIEGLNKHVGTAILATGEIVEGFDDILSRYLGDFQFVGKSEAIPIYEIMALRPEATDRQTRLRQAFADAMAAYRDADWQLASERLVGLLAEFPDDGPARFFLERAARFSQDPDSADNGGVVRMTAK